METQSLEEICGHNLVKKINSDRIDEIKIYQCLDCNGVIEDRKNIYTKNFRGYYDKAYI